ncbi:MAG: 2'-5' RNA ligase family protein [Desulfobacterales bacterium]|jgi:2'-5' RNA ligase
MGGRFGKYGDLKRRKALQRGRREKSRIEKTRLTSARRRRGLPPSSQRASAQHSAKTYKTAVVAIPPDHLWGPIQRLRKQHDRQFRRWMPHITLLYPFRPATAFEQVTPHLSEACRFVEPFEVKLSRFDLLIHSRRKATLYLIPESAGGLKALQKALLEIVPECDDVTRFAGGFRPHLSVGQTSSQEADALRARLQATWQPHVFTLTQVCLIWRNDPPDDVFRVGPVLSLGR